MSDDTGGGAGPANPPDDETLRRRAMYDSYWTEQQTRERANSDKYDNTILAYSTGALALSITFIKELVPLATAHDLWTIKTSWVLFATSMLLMLLSFPIASEANRQSTEFAHKYFIERDNNYHNKQGAAAKTLKWLNLAAGLAFFAACSFTIAFVWINVHDKENTAMSDKTTTPGNPNNGLLNEGMQSATMQTMHKGQQSAAMPPAPPAQAPAPAPSPAPAPTPSNK
ncbi:hypothetical protein SAMN05216570_1024 [Dyella sp. OK004]|uniref:hypothetical protein n=1 Tax=Dyella sp. OK004 TaxID=1855292 RepID=UPI0008E83068|nr:hypothetical protein [Dyella sp. OK004]SFR94647.1 hypothetical protein SAMN05216570_1024 [Dyella sp. OK004]